MTKEFSVTMTKKFFNGYGDGDGDKKIFFTVTVTVTKKVFTVTVTVTVKKNMIIRFFSPEPVTCHR